MNKKTENQTQIGFPDNNTKFDRNRFTIKLKELQC